MMLLTIYKSCFKNFICDAVYLLVIEMAKEELVEYVLECGYRTFYEDKIKSHHSHNKHKHCRVVKQIRHEVIIK